MPDLIRYRWVMKNFLDIAREIKMLKKTFSLFFCFVFSVGYGLISQPCASHFLSNVFIKAEIGYSFSNHENFSPESPKTGWTNPNDNFSDKIGNSTLYGIGLGYIFNPYFYSDLTYTLRNDFQYDKTFLSADRKRTFDIKNQTFMLNFYLQANSQIQNSVFNKLHPFVGAGIGYAWNKTDHFNSTVISNPVSRSYAQSGNHKTSLAWEAMAGVNYNIIKNLMAELGYRYIHIGKISTGKITCSDCSLDSDPLTATRNDLQEAFLSLNYLFK